MSLNAAERRRTAEELARNAALSGLDREELMARAGLSARRFDAAMGVSAADPVDVWTLRDVLETAVRENGREPVAFSVLTEPMRARAAIWFGIGSTR